MRPPADIKAAKAIYYLKNRGLQIGRLMLTTCNQAAGAPLMDSCTTRDQAGNVYHGKCFLLKPWRKNKWGEHLPQPAMVIAWRRHN